MVEMAGKQLARMRRAIEQGVLAQGEDLDPPETRETLDRLLARGLPRDEALRLIGYVVGVEFFQAIGREGGYDHQRFVERLGALPSLPFKENP